jgi:hypothetical protein
VVRTLTKPHRYVLGSKPEIDLTVYNEEGVRFTPSESRLSVKDPTGVITTYSGGDLTQGSGYLFVLYKPLLVGYYEYEGWAKDGAGREIASTASFEVYDKLY